VTFAPALRKSSAGRFASDIGNDCFQCQYLFIRLHDPDEHMKIESDYGANDENPVPDGLPF
jgi:hypothetical protein